MTITDVMLLNLRKITQYFSVMLHVLAVNIFFLFLIQYEHIIRKIKLLYVVYLEKYLHSSDV